MAFREKLAWIILLAGLATYPFYIWALLHLPHILAVTMALLGVTFAAQWILITLASIILAVANIADAKGPADERDRSIAQRASQIAYYGLSVFVMLVAVVMPFFNQGLNFTYAAIFSFTTAELLRQLATIYLYRMGFQQ